MKNLCSILLFITMACVIGLLNWYATATMSDDVLYRFIWKDRTFDAGFEPVRNFGDVIRSQMNHYVYINGRSMTHGLAQTAINLIPEDLAKLLNTVMFCVLIVLMTKYVSAHKEKQAATAALAFGLLFLVVKGFGTGFIWLLGSFTYLWALVMTMCFLLMLRKVGHRDMSWKLAALIPPAFLMGWTHEAIALPLSVALAAFLLTHRRAAAREAITYLALAYSLGMLMIVVSPALRWRADFGGMPLTQRMMTGILNILFGLRVSWVLMATLVIVFLRNKGNFWKYIRQYQFLLIAWTAAIGVVLCCGTSVERVAICADFIAMLIVLSIWQNCEIEKYHAAIICTVCLMSIAVSIPAVSLSYENHQNYVYLRSQMVQRGNELIKVRQLPADMDFLRREIARRYINPTVEFNFYNCYMAFDEHDLNNRAAAALYGKDRVILLPEDVISRIENDSLAYRKMECDEHGDLYILQLNDKKTVRQVKFRLGDELPLWFYQKPFSYPGRVFVLDSFNHEVIEIGNRCYLVMTIPTSNIKRRITDVEL